MYSYSSARVKFLNKLSDRIDIMCATEQGHPIWTELFKCFINDLSEQLNIVIGQINAYQYQCWTEQKYRICFGQMTLSFLALDNTSLSKNSKAQTKRLTQLLCNEKNDRHQAPVAINNVQII